MPGTRFDFDRATAPVSPEPAQARVHGEGGRRRSRVRLLALGYIERGSSLMTSGKRREPAMYNRVAVRSR